MKEPSTLITTCASLIVIHFGLLLAFKVQGSYYKVSPEFFFVISAALFAISLYPVGRLIRMQSPDSIKGSFRSWVRWKLRGHRVGFGFFIVGLLAMAVTLVIPQPSSDHTKNIQNANGTASINGKISMVGNITGHILANGSNSTLSEMNTVRNTGNAIGNTK